MGQDVRWLLQNVWNKAGVTLISHLRQQHAPRLLQFLAFAQSWSQQVTKMRFGSESNQILVQYIWRIEKVTLRQTKIAMENGPFQDVFISY